MVTATIDDKVIRLEGLKTECVRVEIDYDDVPHEEVEVWTMELVKVLNDNGF